ETPSPPSCPSRSTRTSATDASSAAIRCSRLPSAPASPADSSCTATEATAPTFLVQAQSPRLPRPLCAGPGVFLFPRVRRKVAGKETVGAPTTSRRDSGFGFASLPGRLHLLGQERHRFHAVPAVRTLEDVVPEPVFRTEGSIDLPRPVHLGRN